MKKDGRLLAWIEENSSIGFTAYLISSTLKESSLPFSFISISRLKAENWVESQAEALELPVDWISGPH